MELNITNARKQFEQLEKGEPEQQLQQQHKQHQQASNPPVGGVPLFGPSPSMPTSQFAPQTASIQNAVAANGAPLAGVGVPPGQIFSTAGGYLPAQPQMLMLPPQQQLPPPLAAEQPN